MARVCGRATRLRPGMTHTVVAASNHYKVGAPLGGPLFLCPGLESNGQTVRFLPWTLGVWYAWYKSGRSRQKVSYTMLYTTGSTTYHLSDLVHVPDGTYLRLDREGLLPISWAFGYQVAHTNTYVPVSAYTARTPEGVRDIILNYPVHADGYLGVWTDKDGLTYVERTYWVEHLDPAIALAQIWDQECFWDWANDEEVRLVVN